MDVDRLDAERRSCPLDAVRRLGTLKCRGDRSRPRFPAELHPGGEGSFDRRGFDVGVPTRPVGDVCENGPNDLGRRRNLDFPVRDSWSAHVDLHRAHRITNVRRCGADHQRLVSRRRGWQESQHVERSAMRRAIRNEPEGPTAADPADVRETAAGSTGRLRARRRSIVIAVALGALVLGAAYLVSKPGSDKPTANGAGASPSYAEIESFVQGEMAAQRVPGLALGIVEGDRIAYIRGFGKADDSGRAVTPQTPFIIGSVAKSFTALAIMQLVEANKIDLDAPVQRYLPWFRVADEKASAEITVRHLLNHTSGISTKTGRSYQGDGDTSATALEQAVRKLKSAGLSAPVG